MFLPTAFPVLKALRPSVLTMSTCCYFFQGEIALLTDQPRLATVTAVTNTSLLELEKSAFMAVFAGESSEALADFELRLFRCVGEGGVLASLLPSDWLLTARFVGCVFLVP